MSKESLIIHQLHEKINRLEKELSSLKKRENFEWDKEDKKYSKKEAITVIEELAKIRGA